MIVSLEREMDKLVAENQQLLDSVADLEEQLGIDPAEKEEEKPAPVDLSPEDRMKLLVESVEEMIEDDDPLNFTSAGMPRVERLEDFSGLSDVSAEERNEAYRIVKAE